MISFLLFFFMKVYKDSGAITTSSITTGKHCAATLASKDYCYRLQQQQHQEEEGSGTVPVVPDLTSTSLNNYGGTLSSAHEMDPLLDTTAWSRYEIDCALQSQDQEFYQGFKDDKMTKVESKVRKLFY